jgi:hypothetical protein
MTGSMIRNLLTMTCWKMEDPLLQHEEKLEKSQTYEELQVFGTDKITMRKEGNDYA